jgi:UDP-N-acetylmuramoyl-L-alanyl-D-glutamate--2,6-diaminopimelate ligase
MRHPEQSLTTKVTRKAGPRSISLREAAASAGDVVVGLRGDPETRIGGLAYDWRLVPEGHMFFCIAVVVDGHALAPSAVESGAAALCVESPLDLGVPELIVGDVRLAMARIAAEFYRRPADDLTLLGVTGTSGKTTTALLLESILRADGRTTGLIGSQWWRIDGEDQLSAWTTPEAPVLHWLLSDMRDRGVDSVALEVSSHGLRLKRIEGLLFASAVFTNLSHDHLDFHADLDDYFEAKRSLFDPERIAGGAVNVDDPYGSRLMKSLEVPGLGFGLSREADVRAEQVMTNVGGSKFQLVTPGGRIEVTTPLVGMFNVYNCLGAAAGALRAGIGLEAIGAGIESLTHVPGRFERIDLGQPFAVVVDYAHAPSSFETLLRTARMLGSPQGRLVCVFGCGGSCDRSKRPVMGGLAARLANLVVLTSDNPRFEDPGFIIAEVLQGLLLEGAGDAEAVLPDRREAIAHALSLAHEGDVVVIAGKGAEQSQDVLGRKLPFDDREVTRQALGELGWDGAP